jgi:two-component system, OmpR family, sensor histidine kinase KdpD
MRDAVESTFGLMKRIPWWQYVAALIGVALVSVVIELVLGVAHIANVSMLYLIVVLAAATLLGRGPAILASVAAFLTFDWLFTSPRHTFTVADPAEWVALILFLLTAVTASQLAAGQRRQAIEAQQREREAVVLYDVTRLLGDPDLKRALATVAERLRRELRSSAVVVEITDGDLGRVSAASGEASDLAIVRRLEAAPARLLGRGSLPSMDRRGEPGRWIRVVAPSASGDRPVDARSLGRLHAVPIRAFDRQVGVLLLLRETSAPAFGKVDDRLLSAVGSQLGQTAERERLRREATETEILRRTDELRRALLNAVSHDLRTPLSSIMAGAESLLQSDVGWTDEDRREFAQSIRTESRRLNRIVDNLLDLSRIEAGSLRPQKELHDLRILVADVLGRLRPLTAPRDVSLDASEDLPPVELDYVEIDQVLSNLIENAVKYTPAGTPIAVSVRPHASEVIVEVEDRGPGVPPADLSRLFEPFYRSDTGGPRPRGSGLGLAVVRGLVEAHGGRVWAENRPGGARFAFALPVSPTAIPSGESSDDEAANERR